MQVRIPNKSEDLFGDVQSGTRGTTAGHPRYTPGNRFSTLPSRPKVTHIALRPPPRFHHGSARTRRRAEAAAPLGPGRLAGGKPAPEPEDALDGSGRYYGRSRAENVDSP